MEYLQQKGTKYLKDGMGLRGVLLEDIRLERKKTLDWVLFFRLLVDPEVEAPQILQRIDIVRGRHILFTGNIVKVILRVKDGLWVYEISSKKYKI